MARGFVACARRAYDEAMLSEAEKDACLEVLYRGLVEIRAAAGAGESENAAAVADALHNLPHFIGGLIDRNDTVQEFRAKQIGWRLRRIDPKVAAHILEPLELLR